VYLGANRRYINTLPFLSFTRITITSERRPTHRINENLSVSGHSAWSHE